MELPSGSWRDAVVSTALPWCVARVAVLFGLILATVATDQLGVAHPAPLVDKLLAWDAHQYERIAEHGYRAIPYGFRFFPAFPLLGRTLGTVLGGHDGLALLLLANVAAFALGVVVYRLVFRETGNPRTARLSTWLLLATPATAPLVMGYSESFGLLAVVLAFYAMRTNRWRAAVAPAAVVGLTWSIGAFLAVPVAIEAAGGWRRADGRERWWRGLTVTAPVVATGAYLLWVQHETGHWYRDVFQVQSTIYHRGFHEPITRIIESGRDLVAGHHAQGLQFIWVGLVLALLVVSYRRLPKSYAAWTAIVFTLAISADNIDSFERYITRAFPLAIAGALSLRSERDEWATVSIGLAGLVVYATAIMVGARVP